MSMYNILCRLHVKCNSCSCFGKKFAIWSYQCKCWMTILVLSRSFSQLSCKVPGHQVKSQELPYLFRSPGRETVLTVGYTVWADRQIFGCKMALKSGYSSWVTPNSTRAHGCIEKVSNVYVCCHCAKSTDCKIRHMERRTEKSAGGLVLYISAPCAIWTKTENRASALKPGSLHVTQAMKDHGEKNPHELDPRVPQAATAA